MSSLQPPKLKFFASGNKEAGAADTIVVPTGPTLQGGAPAETRRLGTKRKRNQMRKEERKSKFKKVEKMTKALWHRTSELQRETSWIKDVKKLNKLKKLKNKSKGTKSKQENNKHNVENQIKENFESSDANGTSSRMNLKLPLSVVLKESDNIPNVDIDSNSENHITGDQDDTGEVTSSGTVIKPVADVSPSSLDLMYGGAESSIKTMFPMSMPNLTNVCPPFSATNCNKSALLIRTSTGNILKRAKRPLPYSKNQSKYKVSVPKTIISSLDKPVTLNICKKKTETPKFRSFVKATPKDGYWGFKEQVEHSHQSVLESPPVKSPFADVPNGNGFKNFGNSCYMNAVLQALSGLDEFCACLQSGQEIQGGAMVKTMLNLLNAHQECKDPEEALFTFRQHFVTKVFPLFNNRNQQCASEFLNIVLNEGRREYDVFQKYFQFNYYEETKCMKCEKVTYSRVQEDLMLNLAIPDSTPRVNNIQSLFENQQGTCQECNSDSVTCTFKFSSFPRVLILVLKRYCHEGSLGSSPKKITTPFTPSQILKVKKMEKHPAQLPPSLQEELSPDVPLPNLERKPLDMVGESKGLQKESQSYKLASIVYHHGTGTNIGHYVADVNRGDSTGWLNYDDEVVGKTSLELLEKEENSYILFYCLEKQQ